MFSIEHCINALYSSKRSAGIAKSHKPLHEEHILQKTEFSNKNTLNPLPDNKF